MTKIDWRLKRLTDEDLEIKLQKASKLELATWLKGRMRRAGFKEKNLSCVNHTSKDLLIETVFHEIRDPWPRNWIR